MELTYDTIKSSISNHLQSAAKNFLAVGYYLKIVKEEKIYIDGGYFTLEDFASTEFGITKSTAYRYIQVHERFSKNGGPELEERFSGFSSSKLIEMLTLDQTILETVSPNMTVKEIRALKNVEVEKSADTKIPGQLSLNDDFPEYNPEDRSTVPTSQMPTGIQDIGTCYYIPKYKCSLSIQAQKKMVEVKPDSCLNSCCWHCPEKCICKLVCSTCESLGGSNTVDEDINELWFIEKFFEKDNRLEDCLKICSAFKSNMERGKKIKKLISPYSSYQMGSAEFSYSFGSEQDGIILREGESYLKLSYTKFARLVEEKYKEQMIEANLVSEKEPAVKPKKHNMETELKHCPFCGGKAKFHQFGNPKNFYTVRCTVCHCQTDGHIICDYSLSAKENMRLNQEIWNRRI